jgi:hypothetical protein
MHTTQPVHANAAAKLTAHENRRSRRGPSGQTLPDSSNAGALDDPTISASAVYLVT